MHKANNSYMERWRLYQYQQEFQTTLTPGQNQRQTQDTGQAAQADSIKSKWKRSWKKSKYASRRSKTSPKQVGVMMCIQTDELVREWGSGVVAVGVSALTMRDS